MDPLDRALYRLGDTLTEEAQLEVGKERILSLAKGNKPRQSRRLRTSISAVAAALILGLGMGLFVQPMLQPEPEQELWYLIPKTDGSSEDALALRPTPLQWENQYQTDIPLSPNAPTGAEVEEIAITYVPQGMTAHWNQDSGLLEVADETWQRTIFAKPCLRYELTLEEYEGLLVGYARANVNRSQAGDTGGISWVLRLSEDVYFHISMEGISYEESLLFVKGIKEE